MPRAVSSSASSALHSGAAARGKLNFSRPRSPAVVLAHSAATAAGSSARCSSFPAVSTSMAKAVAANGVPKRPDNPAAMPAMSIILCDSASLSQPPILCDMAAPSWTATPSLPALPPKRWVSQVAQMTKGTRRKGMASRSAWPASKTMPMPFSQPAPYLLYAQAMSAPISPRKGRNQAVCASRTAPRYSSTRPKTASTAPTAMPVGTATAMRTSVLFIISTS